MLKITTTLHYKSKLLFLFPEWVKAVTIGSDVFLRDSKENVHENLIKHELVHVEQYRRFWYVGFIPVYLWQWVRYGFKHNKMPLEIEAFHKSGTF